jgi:hypothetical protein
LDIHFLYWINSKALPALVLAVCPDCNCKLGGNRRTVRIKKKREYEAKGKSSHCPFCLGEKKKQGGIPIRSL